MNETSSKIYSSHDTCVCEHAHHGCCKKVAARIIASVIFMLGLALAGWFVAQGLYGLKLADRYVSVKGIAERTVLANLAIWTINYKEAGDDLKALGTKIDEDQKAIIAFLTTQGFSVANEINVQQTSVIDQYAREYGQPTKPEQRYIISGVIAVNSDKVDLVKTVSSRTNELISKGIVLDKDYGTNPRYLFTRLDTIRPAMLDEATRSARMMAQQFAVTSGSRIGKIRHASQGVFQIFSSNGANTADSQPSQEADINKTIRVVTSIDYYLH